MSKTMEQLAEMQVGHYDSASPTPTLTAQKEHQISQAIGAAIISSVSRLKSPMVNSVDDVIKLVRHKILTKKQACRILFPYLSDKEVEEMASEMVSDIILGEDDGKKES